nr:zinc finger protein 345-like [Maniola hyperantus]
MCESDKTIPYRGVCQKCNQKFSNLYQYKYHMKTMHAEEQPSKLNKCTICLYEFVSNSALVNHMRLHTGEKPFACDKCGKKFAFKVALVKHYCIDGDQPYMKKVSTTEKLKFCDKKPKVCEEKPKVCEICHVQFKNGVTLKNHMTMHTGPKPYTCNICAKVFAFKVALLKHYCINGDQPYMRKVTATEKPKVCQEKSKVCDICHAQFKSEGTLAIHKRKHTPFKCDRCHKEFLYRATLVSHVCGNGGNPYMVKTETIETTIEPIDNIEAVKVETESGIDIEVKDMIEIKRERDELESRGIGMAEIMIEAIKTEIKEE